MPAEVKIIRANDSASLFIISNALTVQRYLSLGFRRIERRLEIYYVFHSLRDLNWDQIH